MWGGYVRSLNRRRRKQLLNPFTKLIKLTSSSASPPEPLPKLTRSFVFSSVLSGTVHLASPHEGRCSVTFISKQYVPSICAGPAASELSEQPVSAGKSHFSSIFCKQGI